MPALISPDIRTEWMIFRRYITRQPKEDTMKLLKELATNSMLVEMFPHLRNCLGEQNLGHLMRIVIETPEKLPDDIVESVVDIWNRKPRCIAV